KLPIPIADGKMKEANYQGLQLEGYDNVRKQFVTTAINNHIGSDTEVQMGNYDAAKRAFTYEWEAELLPGTKTKNKRVLRFIDATHYAEDYYESQNGTDAGCSRAMIERPTCFAGQGVFDRELPNEAMLPGLRRKRSLEIARSDEFLDRVIAKRGLVGYLNNAKWVKLLHALVAHYSLIKECQVKLVWEEEYSDRLLRIDENTEYLFDYYDQAMEAMITGKP
nr:hypothetical protein [Tanacetum cinerariifolium]